MAKDKNTEKKDSIIKSWKGIDFRLYVPKLINKDNKIEVHFTYVNPETNQAKQIKRSTGIDRYATKDIYREQAELLVDTLIDKFLEQDYNFLTNTYPEYSKLTKSSSINKCIDVWLQQRQGDFNSGKIQKQEITSTKMIFMMYLKYLKINHQENLKPEIFTRTDIDRFMRSIEKDTSILNPRFNKDGSVKKKVIPLQAVSYNLYLSRLAFFFEFLIIERLCVFNPTKGAHRYNTSNIKTRYTIFENDELDTVRTLLAESPVYLDLLLASHLLYSFRIRLIEQLRIRVGWINFKTGLLSLPEFTEERGKTVKTTKNGNSETFMLSPKLLGMIRSYVGDNIKHSEHFLFGGSNKVGAKQRFYSYFSNKWARFREDKKLPLHLKLYALKHTSNYNSFEELGIEGLSAINRHSKISQTQVYIKSKLSKRTITINPDSEF